MISISITGIKEIDNALRAMPLALTHTELGKAHFAAAKPLVEKEKLLAPEGPTGNLVDSIGTVKTSFAKANSLGEVKVGPRRKGGYKGFAGHLVEFGTKKRTNRSGANRGVMPAEPFAAPAFAATKDQVEGLIAVSIANTLVKTIKRNLKR